MKNFIEINECNSCNYRCLSALNIKIDLLTNKFSDYIHTVKYNRGETIIKQGTFKQNTLFLKSGLVKLYMEGANNKNIIIDFATDNKYLNYYAENDTEFYPFSVTALKESQICFIKPNLFSHFKNSEIPLKNINNLISKELNYLRHQLLILGTRNSSGKLANALIKLSESNLENNDIYKHITRKDLADYASISIESMLKILQELKSDKIIRINGKKIIINDLNMLKRLSIIG